MDRLVALVRLTFPGEWRNGDISWFDFCFLCDHLGTVAAHQKLLLAGAYALAQSEDAQLDVQMLQEQAYGFSTSTFGMSAGRRAVLEKRTRELMEQADG